MKTSREETRRERLRKHITRELKSLDGLDAFTPPEWFEKIEKRPIVDVILDVMCRERGFRVEDPTPEQKLFAEIDDGVERNATTRGRNAHERELARFFVLVFLDKRGGYVPAERLRELVHTFYQKGDFGLCAAVRRAILAGLDSPKC